MIVRIFIVTFASVGAGLSYLTGFGKLMTLILLGFASLASAIIGVMLTAGGDSTRMMLPGYEKIAAWPYFFMALIMIGMVAVLFFYRSRQVVSEPVERRHFKYLIWGGLGFLGSLLLAGYCCFPAVEKQAGGWDSSHAWQVVSGTLVYLAGIWGSCYSFYLASRGSSEENPDMMRRFVLASFTFLQLDKLPLLITYLLIYSPESIEAFSYAGALALTSYIPVGLLLLKITLDLRENAP